MIQRIFGAILSAAMQNRRKESGGSAPVFLTAPVVNGQPVPGTPVSFTSGTASGVPSPTFTNQWLLDGANIAGATNLTYTPVSGDVGKQLSVRQTATNANGSASSTSASKVVATAPALTANPVILGTPTEGTPVAYTSGSYSGTPAPTVTARQWKRNGSAITGANASTYTPVTADVGSNTLTITETVTNVAGSVSGTSAPASVAAAPSDDWATRSAGALSANRMDTQAARDAMVFLNGKQANVTYDPTVKSGASAGSIRIAVLSANGTDDGVFRFQLGRNFQPGDQFWLSYRVWAPETWVYQPWATGYECGPKMLIIDDFGETSSGDEIVPGMGRNVNEFSGYNQDGLGGFPEVEDGNFTDACSGGPFDVRMQPSIDRGANTLTGTNPDTGAAWTLCEQDRRRYGSLYQVRNNATNVRPGLGDPFGGGARMKARTWYTRTMHIVIGTPGVANSTWQEWVAEDGQPYQKLWDKSDRKFGTPVANGINTGHFMPYVTGRSPGGRKITGTNGTIGGVSVMTCGMGTEMGSCTLRYDASVQRFSFRTPNDAFGIARGFSVANNVKLLNVCSASDQAFTNLVVTGAPTSITLPQATIDVTSTANFPSAGTFVIGDPVGGAGGVGEERVQYTGKTATSFTGCTGGTGLHNEGESINFASYVTVRIDNTALLPTTGITDMTVTVADGRPDTEFHYADVICSLSAINAPGGFAPVAGTSALATAVAGMAPGTWTELVTNNLANFNVMFQVSPSTGAGNILADSCNGTWDNAHGIAHFVGQNHGAGDMRHIWYTESTNTWSGASTGMTDGHGLSEIACDVFTGDVYFTRYNDGGLAKKPFGQAWNINFKPFPGIDNNTHATVFWTGALLGVTGGAGAVVTHEPDFGDMWVYDVGANVYTLYSAVFLDEAPGYDNVGGYNPNSNFYCGAGGNNPSTVLQRINSLRQRTTFDAAPMTFSIREGTLCHNPAIGAGSFLTIQRDRHIYDLNVSGASLIKTDLGLIPAAVNEPPSTLSSNSLITIPISPYGVLMVVSADASSSANVYLYKPPVPATYTTTFATAENPLSDGGRWTGGGAFGWNNMQATGGNAVGTTHTPSTYQDNLAILSGYNINYFIEGVIHRAAGYNPATNHEIELLVRFSLSSGNAHGYEVLVNAAGGSDIVRWNGAVGDFTAGQGTGAGIGAVANGDVIRVEVVGTTITVKKALAASPTSFTTVMTATGITWATGAPGIGAFSRGGDVVLANFGWQSITVGAL